MKQFQLLFLFLAFFSCGQKSTTTTNPAPAIQYTGGKTYNENNYSLYLPANYDTTKIFPVIYFFDPQGKGNLPLEKYKSIADSLGIIFVGSNATKNGMQWAEVSTAANQLFNATKQKLKINQQKIFTCGFSGGARIASNLAVQNNNIAAVISCSAGLPAQASQLRNNLIFVGIAGKEDMNLSEIYEAGEALKNSELKHLINYFDGPHEWPPLKTMSEAIQFCLAPVAVKNENTISKKIIETEKQQKQFYSEAFVKNDFNWWNTEFKSLEQKIAKSNGDEKFMNIRLKNFLSLAAFSYSNSALNTGKMQEADKFLSIYKLVDPDNAEHAYLRTKYFMLLNNTSEAEKTLNEAAALGFSDIERLRSEQLFITLQNTEAYKKITGQ
ncbi:MAG: hypothetical protein POELPBGB_01021 [Bacteroidia bacterium]|nr:hypothetical protein [Bacteroidia bacterium]